MISLWVIEELTSHKKIFEKVSKRDSNSKISYMYLEGRIFIPILMCFSL